MSGDNHASEAHTDNTSSGSSTKASTGKDAERTQKEGMQVPHGGGGGGGAEGARDRGSMQVLVDANSHVTLWGEILKPELTVHVLNGKLRVNDEIRYVCVCCIWGTRSWHTFIFLFFMRVGAFWADERRIW